MGNFNSKDLEIRKRTEKKNETYRKSLRKLLWVIPVLAIGLLVVFNVIFVIYIVFNDNVVDVGKVIEADGLSMIGIAISVWIGINVYNFIDRREIQKVDHDIKHLKGQVKKFQTADSLLEKSRKTTQSLLVQQYISQIYELNDLSNNDFAKKIEKKSHNIQLEGIVLLQEIETLSSRVYREHYRDGEKNEENLREWAKKGIACVNRYQEYYRGQMDSDLENLLEYRVGDFWFYQGYCEKGEKRVEAFKNAYDRFEKVAIEYKYLTRGNGNELVSVGAGNKLSDYYLNAIGECCEMIWEGYNEKNQGSEYEALMWIKRALCLTRQSAEEGDITLPKKMVYYRNYACTIMNAIKAGLYNEEREEIEKMLELASVNAKKAIKLAPNQEKGYRTFLSVANAECRFWLEINEPHLGDTDNEPNYIVDKDYTPDVKEKLGEKLKDVKVCSEIAHSMFPNKSYFAAMDIFFTEYEMILNKNNRLELLEQMKDAVQLINFYVDKDGEDDKNMIMQRVARERYTKLEKWLNQETKKRNK